MICIATLLRCAPFLLSWQNILSLIAVYCAYRFGCHVANLAGGVLLAGLVACLPMYIEFAGMSRSYSDAWSFAWIAIGLFAWPQSKLAAVGRAAAYGWAVSSRIDMLGLSVALVLLHFRNGESARSSWARVLRFAAGSAAVAYMTAPWILTNLVGLLRTMVTVRVAGQFSSPNPRWDTAVQTFWLQGLGLLFLVTAVALPLVIRRLTWPERGLVLFALLLVLSMFTGPYQPMGYHGAALITVFLVAAIVMGRIGFVPQRFLPIAALFFAALPLWQSVQLIRANAEVRCDADVVRWIEANVPAGSPIYFFVNREAEAVLPTPESSQRIWDEVTDRTSWQRKFQRGLERFNLKTPWVPRAFSEENLWLERGDVRRWFILGSEVDRTRPRYDLRLDLGSPVFGEHKVLTASRKTGGFVIHRGQRPSAGGGTIRQEWLAPDGTGVFIVEVAKQD